MKKAKIPKELRALTRFDGQFWHAQNCEHRTTKEITRHCGRCGYHKPACNFQQADGGRSVWCRDCRQVLFEKLTAKKADAREEKRAAVPLTEKPSEDPFEAAFQKAMLAGAAKHKALTLTGLRQKKAWSAFYAIEAQARKMFEAILK